MPDHFHTMRTRVIEGASFAVHERVNVPNALVVSAAFGQLLFSAGAFNREDHQAPRG
jgi:hypothetical protein